MPLQPQPVWRLGPEVVDQLLSLAPFVRPATDMFSGNVGPCAPNRFLDAAIRPPGRLTSGGAEASVRLLHK